MSTETLFITNFQDLTQKHYIELLEKTNEQLSLWSNPYGFLVAVLAALFTIITLAFAYGSWKYSKEQKETYITALNTALNNYQKSLDENLQKIGEEAEAEIQKFIDKQTVELKELKGEAKAQVQATVEEIKKEKDTIASRLKFSSATNISAGHPIILQSSNGTVFGTGGATLSGGVGSGYAFGSSGTTVSGGGNIYFGTHCQKCGWRDSSITSFSKVNYCPNCGAKI